MRRAAVQHGYPEVKSIRADFPLLREHTGLHYLDNAATTHKPQAVIDAIADCYRHAYAPVHRGLYPLAEAASEDYEQARARIAHFIGAATARQLVFTRSATEAINMVARGWAQKRLRPGDEIWVSRMEHHANYLPWQAVCRETGAQLRIIELQADGRLDLAATPELFGPRTRLLALCHVSNVLGVINPVREIVAQARAANIPVLVDAAQSVGHLPVNVAELDCDFLVFSAHKLFGPTGIGALYGKAGRFEEMQPLLLGGGMVDRVGESESQWAEIPARFEAGSPNLADALGFAAAVDYIEGFGVDAIEQMVSDLTHCAITGLEAIPGVTLYGPCSGARAGIVAFNLEGIHAHDLAQVAAEHGVAIRAGHHCCQPLMQHLGVAATARASLAPYNDATDIKALLDAVKTARDIFA